MFTSSSQYYEKNVKEAATAQAGKARLHTPTGEQIPGVVIWSGKAVRIVLPIPEALRLANEIADVLASPNKAS